MEVTSSKKLLRTEKGSLLRRNPKIGVGKTIGGCIYLHRQYTSRLGPEGMRIVEAASKILKEEDEHFANRWNIIKLDTNDQAVTFIESQDFDEADEPQVHWYIKIKDNYASHRNTTLGTCVYHHKWLFVDDDYQGFDVEKSFERSKKIVKIANLDTRRIGQKEYWERLLENHGGL